MKITVIGGGIMGSGIGQVAAQAGLDVTIVDVSEAGLDKAKTSIAASLEKFESKKKVQSAADVLNRIQFSTDWSSVGEADAVIEAVPEKLELKKQVFEKLDRLAGEDCLLASNTSTLSITAIAGATSRPEKVIGMHFFSPVPMMALLELVKGYQTSEETVEKARQLGVQLGKRLITAEKDYPGFLMNRIWLPMVNEACFALMEGVGTAEEIDQGFIDGYGHKMGPLRTIDMAGIDTTLWAMESLYEGFGDPKYRPCPILKKMVEAGDLGKKTGKGFYSYEGGVKEDAKRVVV
ncbi:3-hydroxybutyryl-CoA dehydrogenase [Bhargavaea cecembensis]|uniref:3-hydroxybutyryl-CoA dehydrogenase n=1 Tax=Bhargavaea cecembensis TaxID=394098 RepID=A0A165H584_9BACL|nr:3-hydroxyacyl-CoA dehydrogenase NAD-binding domain-containing protein [Bhargavaea cecembensis]KZE38808.1 3-hydroxybutyryl-CoA dehydrogenase [Bhargavaea cecembensis]